MLAGKSLLELHLLLHFYLLVCQDRMLAGSALASRVAATLLDLLSLRSQNLCTKCVAVVAEHHCIVVLDRRNVHRVSHGP